MEEEIGSNNYAEGSSSTAISEQQIKINKVGIMNPSTTVTYFKIEEVYLTLFNKVSIYWSYVVLSTVN